MTPLLDSHLTALRICALRLHALECDVLSFNGGAEFDAPIVRIVAPSAALFDYLDSRQMRIYTIASMRATHLDGCTVCWPLTADMRVDEVEHIEVRA